MLPHGIVVEALASYGNCSKNIKIKISRTFYSLGQKLAYYHLCYFLFAKAGFSTSPHSVLHGTQQECAIHWKQPRSLIANKIEMAKTRGDIDDARQLHISEFNDSNS